MPGNFNFIAPVYDSLAFLVYGNNLIRAKKIFLQEIPARAQILLMGGGTGNILNDLIEKNPEVHVDFVEPSTAMIRIAEKNLKEKFRSRVNFISGNHLAIPSGVQYDAVTSFFVVDCFPQEDAIEFTTAITSSLKSNGLWLFADFFDTGKFHHRAMLWFMYRFFRTVAGIPASQLPDYAAIFRAVKFSVKEEKKFLNGLIRSLMLRRE